MKKSLAVCLLLALSSGAKAADPVLFTVNGIAVTGTMMQHMAQGIVKPGTQPTEQIQQVLLSEMVNRVVLSQAAESAGLDKKAEHQAGLQMERISYLANAALQEQARSFTPDDNQIQALYDKQHSQPSQEFKARHILLKEEAEAEKLIAELQGGADFAELAKQHSTGPTGPKGGDLGWFGAGTMVKPFAEAVSGMKKGSYTDKPVKTQFGWHLILLEDSRELPAKPLDQLKPQLIAELRQKALQDYLEQLRTKAVVEQAK
jgi:peptidyl-prolyl cis-trans isomerase C